MSRRRSRLPKGARTAARILKFLGAGGTVMLLVVCLVIAFAAIGSKYVTTASGETACQLPDSTGGPGVAVFGDSTVTGLAGALPTHLAGGKVTANVEPARIAQQGVNIRNTLADSAPAIFVISLAEDDASSANAYTARIDELLLLLSGRIVYWITAPGKDVYTKIVNAENTTDRGSPESAGGWHVVDFAGSVKQHPDWWDGGKPTAAGLKNLAQTLSQITPATTGGSADPGSANGITVTSTVNAGDRFTLTGERLTNAQTPRSTRSSSRSPAAFTPRKCQMAPRRSTRNRGRPAAQGRTLWWSAPRQAGTGSARCSPAASRHSCGRSATS